MPKLSHKCKWFGRGYVDSEEFARSLQGPCDLTNVRVCGLFRSRQATWSDVQRTYGEPIPCSALGSAWHCRKGTVPTQGGRRLEDKDLATKLEAGQRVFEDVSSNTYNRGDFVQSGEMVCTPSYVRRCEYGNCVLTPQYTEAGELRERVVNNSVSATTRRDAVDAMRKLVSGTVEK